MNGGCVRCVFLDFLGDVLTNPFLVYKIMVVWSIMWLLSGVYCYIFIVL